MKRLFFFAILIILSACDDGDLQVEIIDFDSAGIQTCDLVSADDDNVFFKLNTAEALILELPDAAINNMVTDEIIRFDVTETGATRVTYRTFSGDVSANYFCSDIPLSEPTVVEEVIGQGGEVLITTALNADGVTYEHTIELSAISFVTSDDTRITNLAIANFGTVTTTAPE